MRFSLKANIVDIPSRKIFSGTLQVKNGKIAAITNHGKPDDKSNYLLPGFVDAHVHIESSMLVPAEFARLAVLHGTVATVSDPHEIANVCGAEGVEFMIANGNTVPFKFHFGAPSCVPATSFETAGAVIDSLAIDRMLAKEEIYYLSEMMNFPGVLNGDKEVMEKLALAKKYNKPVDGHSPGLRGSAAQRYISGGERTGTVVISTDHECFTKEEAMEKLHYGMKILIREGSAAKNFDALIDLLRYYPDQIMFCSDDKHPDSLLSGHINELCARAVERGVDVFHVLQAACVNPVVHYNMRVGLMRIGDPADFIMVKNLEDFNVVATYIDGLQVAENGATRITTSKPAQINNFTCRPKKVTDFEFPVDDFSGTVQGIVCLDGQLITNKIQVNPPIKDGCYTGNTQDDILKIVVANRYEDAPVAKAFIKNFGLKQGAIASSVAHDSHNIIAVGVDDESLCTAVNLLIEKNGGICCVGGEGSSLEKVLPLPVAGLMSDDDGFRVAAAYTELDKAAKALGSALSAPFMTLSFMALLVIPHLKLSDKGLFDGDRFTFAR